MTRFGDFFCLVMATNFLAKVAQIFAVINWGELFWQEALLSKNWCGYVAQRLWNIGLLFILTSGHTDRRVLHLVFINYISFCKQSCWALWVDGLVQVHFTWSWLKRNVKSWSSSVEGNEEHIGPSGKLLLLWNSKTRCSNLNKDWFFMWALKISIHGYKNT